MPLARIDPIEGKSVEYRRTIADVVYDKMIEYLGVLEDRFQTFTEHKADNFYKAVVDDLEEKLQVRLQ